MGWFPQTKPKVNKREMKLNVRKQWGICSLRKINCNLIDALIQFILFIISHEKNTRVIFLKWSVYVKKAYLMWGNDNKQHHNFIKYISDVFILENICAIWKHISKCLSQHSSLFISRKNYLIRQVEHLPLKYLKGGLLFIRERGHKIKAWYHIKC